MFEFTKHDLASFYQYVVVNVAQRLGIKEAEWKSIGELGIEISKSNSDIYEILVQFFKDYQAWYDYSYDEKGVGKSFDFTNDSGTRYIDLSNKRDETRSLLLQKLNA
ncbi:hypothetical protein [Methylophilus sp. YYY-1]|uniref:Uncharacterized protein n=1 Tax=Methylophilus glucosoxydans TaxID=752553 RepID=A0ABW3GR52_9PROT|nr:hypothetical protein [Methylophilus sp. YYY-1]MDF0378407.1 hypothetical protein [Methylophilus sp. YYY-1]